MKVVQLNTAREGIDVEDLAQQLHDEFGATHEFDRNAISEQCLRCVSDPDRKYLNCWIAYDDNNTPIGFLAATAYRSFYSYRMYTMQEMWFVVPRARRYHTAAQLILEYETWAMDMQAERIYTQVEHDNKPELVQRIFTMLQFLGYNRQGYIAVKRPNYNINEDNDDDRSTHRGVGAEQAQVKQ